MRVVTSVVDGARKVDSKTGRGRMVKCKATSKRSGERCKRWAVDGATVCPMHGAAKGTPARRKAEEQLREARDELMEMLLGIARDARVSASERLKAITWALERAGFKGAIGVDLTVEPGWTVALKELFEGKYAEEPEPIKVEATAGPPVPARGAVEARTEADPDAWRKVLGEADDRAGAYEGPLTGEVFQPQGGTRVGRARTRR